MFKTLVRIAVRRRLRQVEAAYRDPGAVQAARLLDLVRRAARTEWGRQHGYHRVRSIRDFQSATPPTRYEDMAPLWHRAFDGERDLAWPGHVRYFALTSGTTLGASKAMPVTMDAIRANRRAGVTLVGYLDRQAPAADLTTGRTLYFGGCTRLRARGACLQGDASGINALHVPRIARRYRLPERDISDMSDWEAKVEAICARYATEPVRAVVGLPSWTLILFRRLVETAGEKLGRRVDTVADVWPDLSVFIHFGMSFAPYRRQFEQLVGKPIVYVDTYSSSEGGLNAVQTCQDDPGMLLEIDGGVFFEFVPLEELGSEKPTRLTIETVEPGHPYAVLLTTNSGMWSYDVGDVVRFTSLGPPKFVFAARADLQLNALGEHVLQEHLDGAVAEMTRELGVTVRDFTVTPVLPEGSDPRGGHRWLLEFEGPAAPAADVSRHIDAAVCAASDDYASHRAKDYGMRPPEIVQLAPGTFYAWSERKGKLGGQHKVPRIAPTDAMIDELLEISRAQR